MDSRSSIRLGRLAAGFALVGLLTFLGQAQAQPTITSTVPADGATGVSTTTTVVFTFSAAMTPGSTTVFFYDPSFTLIATTPSWTVGNTVLTCTPISSFPPNSTITWVVSGAGGIPTGTFTTGSGGSSGGSGTNAITSFTLGKMHTYHQTSTSLPTLDPDVPYAFSAMTTLSSNRTATNILLRLPTGGISNLVQNPYAHEQYTLFAFNTNLTTFEASFPSGYYTNTVKAVASNQTVAVNFPAGLAQPGAPHVANYTAAQSVNATQAFVLTWDAFPGGTAADAIQVEIGDVFSSTNLGSPGALTGTATSLTIPAGKLQPGTTYDSWISFYRQVSTTNGSSYVTWVYRTTFTDFTLVTASSSGPSLVLTNAVLAPANFSFDVLCATGQTVTVEYRTNLALGQWRTLLTTNSPGSRFRAIAPQAVTNRSLFFRANRTNY
jgi:hypothetical protein